LYKSHNPPRPSSLVPARGAGTGNLLLRRLFAGLAPVLAAAAIAGCGSGRLPTAPVEGKVLYEGEPLTFGGVIFQPEKGPLARGYIQPDGTFRLFTYADGDGAVLGRHFVQITCFETQNPEASRLGGRTEPGLGRSLIPKRYNRFQTSGLRAEVKAHNEPFVFELSKGE